jgi:hypothetical protein
MLDTFYRSLSFLSFPEYRVGRDGSVWSLHGRGPKRPNRNRHTWHKLRQYPNQHGHLWVLLYNKTGKKKFQVHRLVLLAFVGPCPEGMEACHSPDACPTNNWIDNLRWDTHQKNQQDMANHGNSLRGIKNPASKLKNPSKDVPAIHQLRTSGKTLAEIAGIYGMTVQGIWAILHGKTYKYQQP